MTEPTAESTNIELTKDDASDEEYSLVENSIIGLGKKKKKKKKKKKVEVIPEEPSPSFYDARSLSSSMKNTLKKEITTNEEFQLKADSDGY